MKRIHVHISVEDIEENIRFYSALFNAEPVLQRNDYPKFRSWTACRVRLSRCLARRKSAGICQYFKLLQRSPDTSTTVLYMS